MKALAAVAAFVSMLALCATVVFLVIDSDPANAATMPFDTLTAGGISAATSLATFLVYAVASRKPCPSCGKVGGGKLIAKEFVSSRYRHQRRDGGPDRRYGWNPLIATNRYCYKCKGCGHNWAYTRSG